MVTRVINGVKQMFNLIRKEMEKMREWQQTKFKKLVMPDAVYYQSIWAVRDLYRMEEKLEEINQDIIQGNIMSTGIVSEDTNTYNISKPTEEIVMHKATLERRVNAIRDALEVVPLSYRQFILDNIIRQKSYKCFPNKLWRIWKQRFLFNVAKNLALM